MKKIFLIFLFAFLANEGKAQNNGRQMFSYSIFMGYECGMYFCGGEFNIFVGNYEFTKSIKSGDYIWCVDFNDSFFKSKNEREVEMGKWITQYYNQYVINCQDTKENRRGFILGFLEKFEQK